MCFHLNGWSTAPPKGPSFLKFPFLISFCYWTVKDIIIFWFNNSYLISASIDLFFFSKNYVTFILENKKHISLENSSLRMAWYSEKMVTLFFYRFQRSWHQRKKYLEFFSREVALLLPSQHRKSSYFYSTLEQKILCNIIYIQDEQSDEPNTWSFSS